MRQLDAVLGDLRAVVAIGLANVDIARARARELPNSEIDRVPWGEVRQRVDVAIDDLERSVDALARELEP